MNLFYFRIIEVEKLSNECGRRICYYKVLQLIKLPNRPFLRGHVAKMPMFPVFYDSTGSLRCLLWA